MGLAVIAPTVARCAGHADLEAHVGQTLEPGVESDDRVMTDSHQRLTGKRRNAGFEHRYRIDPALGVDIPAAGHDRDAFGSLLFDFDADIFIVRRVEANQPPVDHVRPARAADDRMVEIVMAVLLRRHPGGLHALELVAIDDEPHRAGVDRDLLVGLLAFQRQS